MHKSFLILSTLLLLAPPLFAHASTPPEALGRILLQVEKNGEAWYVHPDSGDRSYLANGEAAYSALRSFGLGITNADLESIPVGIEARFNDVDADGDGLADQLEDALGTSSTIADTDGDGITDGYEVEHDMNPLGTGSFVTNEALLDSLRGKILLQVQAHGEAWYIHPTEGRRYYMKDGDAAYQIMRFLGLGTSDATLNAIEQNDTQSDCVTDIVCFIAATENRQPAKVLHTVETAYLTGFTTLGAQLYETSIHPRTKDFDFKSTLLTGKSWVSDDDQVLHVEKATSTETLDSILGNLNGSDSVINGMTRHCDSADTTALKERLVQWNESSHANSALLVLSDFTALGGDYESIGECRQFWADDAQSLRLFSDNADEAIEEAPEIALPPSTSTLFTDITSNTGFTHLQILGVPSTELIDTDTLTRSGNAAAADYDNDGLLDVFVSRIGAPGILYRNLGDGVFSDNTMLAGLSEGPIYGSGVAWGDIDNDGDADLYITTLGMNQFYMYDNNGDGTFTEVAEERGADVWHEELHYGQSVTFGDYNDDGWLDIHTTQRHANGHISNTRLLRNRGIIQPGYFDDVTLTAGVRTDDIKGERPTIYLENANLALDQLPYPTNGTTHDSSSSFVDIDGDGWQDLAIVADFGMSRVFWNNGDGTFDENPSTMPTISGIRHTSGAFGDIDGDGHQDWVIAAQEDGLLIYHNNADRTFTETHVAHYVNEDRTVHDAVLTDSDNDGDLDIIVVGNTSENTSTISLWLNDGMGVFTEDGHTLGLRSSQNGVEITLLDLDNDNDVDVFVTNNSTPPQLFRNNWRPESE